MTKMLSTARLAAVTVRFNTTRQPYLISHLLNHSFVRYESRFAGLVKSTLQNIPEVSVTELDDAIAQPPPPNAPSPIVIDVRENDEVKSTGIIPGSLHIPRGILEREIENVLGVNSKPHLLSSRIVVVCAGGMRSVLAADSLKRMGFNDVKSLKGGMGAWQAEGFEVKK